VAHLTFPDEIQESPASHESAAGEPKNRITDTAIAPPKQALLNAVEQIKKARRPVIIMGHGSRFHKQNVIAFAEMLNAPVFTTFKGKGLIPDSHPLGCGVLGRSGTPIASWFMNESDLVIAFGASFSKHTGIAPYKPIIQVDSDPLALAKFHQIEVALWGDISVTVEQLMAALSIEKLNTLDQRQEVKERWAIWRNEKKTRLTETSPQGVSSIRVFESMNTHTPKNAVMCVDVGNNAYSFGRYFESMHQDFLMSGYLGSIGFALPASIGAWAAVKDTRPVVAVAGDGGVSQYLTEITTLVKYKIPVKLIILNNNELGKISKEQRAGEFEVWQTSLVNPDFAAFATSCGAWAKKVSNDEDVDAALVELFSQSGPAVLEVVTDVNLI
jgi:thiamine pyrophosphate-dependent acetolactate synthase large subunit-like protein